MDNNANNFLFQPENGILIKSWYDDADDTALSKLGEILKKLAIEKPEDVRIYLKRLHDESCH